MADPVYVTSADRASATRFFADRAQAHATWEALLQKAYAWGPFQLTATKSRIALLARTRFLWVHEAQLDGSIWIGFLLPHRVDSPRLRSGAIGGRWSHHLKLTSPKDLDREVLGWLHEAYDFDVAGIKDAEVKALRKGPHQ